MFLIAQLRSNISYLCILPICVFFKKKKKVFLAVMAIGKDFLFSIDLLLKELSWNQINSVNLSALRGSC